jgi:TPP-dependent pyruvate/acetoin dehydrogenase alpha subunit
LFGIKLSILKAQYREAGVILWRGYPIQDAAHQIFGNALGSCKGRQMPIVSYYFKQITGRILNFVLLKRLKPVLL